MDDTLSLLLSDGSVAIRFPREEDAPHFWEAVQAEDEEARRWLPLLGQAESLDDVRNYIRQLPQARAARTQIVFAIVDPNDDTISGACWLARMAAAQVFGSLHYWVRASRRGAGIAPRALRLVIRWAFDVLGYQRIELVIARENEASVRVAEKLGALREGFLRNRVLVDGEAREAVIYAIYREDFGLAAPDAPLSPPRLPFTAPPTEKSR